ncbi:MAG TPA: serine protease, partial [Planctomycetota bacterium]|nr:serine protease [Planctomycetota bacterium]
MRTAPGGLVLAVAAVLASPLAAQDSVEDKVGPSVVRILNEESSGSGMFLDTEGLILTNAHVACSPLPFQVRATVKAGGKTQERTFSKVALLGFHPDYDLALLRIDLGGSDAAVKPVALS